MTEAQKHIADGNLTQKEIIQLLLHNAQHMATRDEVKSDIKELRDEVKSDIKELRDEVKSDIKELRDEVKADITELRDEVKSDIKELRDELKADNKNLNSRIDRFMFWSLGLTVTSTFLILGLIYKTIP